MRIRRAALAGLAGTTALAIFEFTVERALLERPPPYAPARIVRILPAGPTAKTLLALALRLGYGLSLAIAYGCVRERLPRSRLASGLLVAAAIHAEERLVLPRLPGMRPFERWSARERALLAARTAVYGVVTATAFDALRTPAK